MRVLLVALFAVAFSLSAAAVDIVLYRTNRTCESDYGGSVTCHNIGPLNCCRYSGYGTFHSAKCSGLRPTDVCAAGGNTGPAPPPPEGTCGPICALAVGAGTHCIGWLNGGNCWEGSGAYWYSSYALNTKCEEVVMPDLATFATGQSFRINGDVPANTTARIVELLNIDPHLTQGVPTEVAPFEMKAEKGA